MRKITVFLLILFQSLHISAQSFDVNRQLGYCHSQILRALKDLRSSDGSYDYSMEPRNILSSDNRKGWNCRKAEASEWCGGFWPGILWMDYMQTGDSMVKKAAEGYTRALRHIAYSPVYDHDIGFLIFCSFGKGYEATHRAGYKNAILASADSLATLFNPMVGTILSWPRNVKAFGGHNTIMDNMMNLDMMFWAARNGGNPLLYDLAVSHAKTTMEHHFRPDGTCYHVAVYDPVDGHFIQGVTHQGFSDRSTWARGQAWAVYGYTMVYRYTHNPVFLNFAEKVTEAYLRRLKETDHVSKGKTYTDLIPKWDFDDPDPKAPKDASAACVVADALLELSQYVVGEKRERYRGIAVETLRQLSTSAYQSGSKNDSFLLHSTGHKPAGTEIDASIIYADYYYLEALTRLKMMQ